MCMSTQSSHWVLMHPLTHRVTQRITDSLTHSAVISSDQLHKTNTQDEHFLTFSEAHLMTLAQFASTITEYR